MSMWEQLSVPVRGWVRPEPISARRVPQSRTYSNPWKLTGREAGLMDVLIEKESDKAAAQALGISPRTVEAHVRGIRKKMGHSRFRCILEWDRWSQAQGRRGESMNENERATA